jgi:hypothetical protein
VVEDIVVFVIDEEEIKQLFFIDFPHSVYRKIGDVVLSDGVNLCFGENGWVNGQVVIQFFGLPEGKRG